MKKIALTAMRVSDTRVDFDFTVSPELEKYFKRHHLFYQYDRSIEMVPRGILVIPFLGTIMQVAWLTDATVEVDVVDTAFAESLVRLRGAYQKMYPNCRLGGVLNAAQRQDNHDWPALYSGQLYSGGLDAATTFIRHREEHPLLILEYGFYDESHFSGTEYEKDQRSHRNFCADRAAALTFAEEQGVKAAFVQANYGTFLNGRAIDRDFSEQLGENFWFGLHHAMALLGAAAPIAASEQIKTLYIASSFTVGNTSPCASDPSTDNEFRFGGCQVCHDGYELSSRQKARLTVQYQKKTGKPVALRVCTWNDRNCCMCEKCLRRMLQIHAEGGDPADFGFAYEGSLLLHLKKYLDKEVQFLSEKNIQWWRSTIDRMQENYDGVFDKATVDFLVEYDFEKEKKRGLWRYYRRNFFSILKRKIKGLLTKGD